MKKLLLLTITLAACSKSDNRAVVMVQAQASKAKCVSATLGNTEVAKCDVPGKDKVVPFIAVYDTNLTQPFQVYPLEQPAKEASPATPPAAPGAGSGANVPTPDAGVGSGSAN